MSNNGIKATFICLCLSSLIFSGAALAANQPGQGKSKAKNKVAVYVLDSTSESFADLLSPGVDLGRNISSLFQKKSGATWTIQNAFLFLPLAQQKLDVIFAFNSRNPLVGWQPYAVNPSVFNFNGDYFQPAILQAFYQEVAAVPEVSSAAMMVMGLPILGWLAWRRQRDLQK